MHHFVFTTKIALQKTIMALIALIPHVACVTSPYAPQAGDGRVIHDVPFYPQEEFQCGPAALASVLTYWNVRADPDEIGREIFSKAARGTLTIDMVLYAQRKGLHAEQLKGDMELLKRAIDSEQPPIVLVDYGISVFQRNHFMVVTGYSRDGVIVHSGGSPNKFLSLKSFLGAWERTGYWTLLIKRV